MASDPSELCPHAGLGSRYNPMVLPDREDPYRTFDHLRAEEPVSYSQSLNMWLISRHDDIQWMLKDQRRLTTEGALTVLSAAFEPEAQALLRQGHSFSAPNMAVVTDSEHARLRGPVHKFFAAHNMSGYESMIRRRASALIDKFPSDGPVDLVEQLAYPFPLQVIFELLGIPDEDHAMLQQGAEAVAVCMTSIVPPDQQVETVRQVLANERYLSDLVAQRRAEPRDDLISMLVQGIDSGQMQLSMPELISTLSSLLVPAGHETTARAIGNGLYYLLTNREHWQALIDDPNLIPNAAEELLRLDAVVLGFFRTTTEPVEVRGVTIPAGASVLLLFASANRDEECFTRPTEYDPSRPNLRDHLAFGQGMHYCLGAHLARLELRVVLELLTTQLPGLQLVPGQEVTHSPSLTMRGIDHLLATVSG